MILYVYIQFILELQNVANCDFRKLKYCVNIDVLFWKVYAIKNLSMFNLAVSNIVYVHVFNMKMKMLSRKGCFAWCLPKGKNYNMMNITLIIFLIQ